MKPTKPLGKKAYGSIPHLINSRRGDGDRGIGEEEEKMFVSSKKNKNDIVIVQEKLDGSNVAIAKINGEIVALIRAGYTALSSPYELHHYFDKWVSVNKDKFYNLLEDGEWVSGEWLMVAHGTLYNLHHEPFVAFDIFNNGKRVPYNQFKERCDDNNIVTPYLVHIGEPISVKEALNMLGKHGKHGAIDEVEGVVYRIERNDEVISLAKFVKQNKEDGKYFIDNGSVFNKINNISMEDMF